MANSHSVPSKTSHGSIYLEGGTRDERKLQNKTPFNNTMREIFYVINSDFNRFMVKFIDFGHSI